MNYQDKTKDELIIELHKLQQKYDLLKTSYEKDITQCNMLEDVEALVLSSLPLLFYRSETSDKYATTWISENVKRITGFDREVFLKKKYFWSSRLHPDDRDRVLRTFNELQESKQGAIEYRWQCANGEYRWFLDSYISFKKTQEGQIEFVGTWVDITESKQLEDALLMEKENFRRSLDDSPLGKRIVTLEGNTIYANKVLLDIYGYDNLKELQKTPLKDRYTPESFSQAQKRKLQRIGGDFSTTDYEISIIRKDGGIRQLQVFRKEILWSGTSQFQVIYNDITERKQIEEKLVKNDNLLHTVLNNAPISMFATDDKGIVILNKGKVLEKVGMKPGENVGTSAYELFSDLKVVENNGTVLNGKAILDRVLNGESLSGVTELNGVFFNNSFSPIHDSNGFISGMIGVATDITDSKMTEKTLRENEERLRDIIFSMGDWVWEVDKNGIYTYVSQKGSDLLGLTYENIIGKTPFDFMSPDVVKRVREIFSELAAKKAPIKDLENWNIGNNGEKICLVTNGVPILDDEGNLKGYRGVDRDITKYKKNEAALKQMNELMLSLNQRLENIRENERAKISRNIHDQLGQSLTSLKFDLGTLINQIESGSYEEVKLAGMIEMVTQIIRNVQRISSELRPPALDELGLAAAMEWYCEDFMERTGLQLHMEIDDVKTKNINKDLALYRVLQEALTNVIRHSSAKNVLVKLCVSEKDILLIIKDDGIGISPDKVVSFKSLGILGMLERIRQYDGNVEITNPDKKGTEVKIRLAI